MKQPSLQLGRGNRLKGRTGPSSACTVRALVLCRVPGARGTLGLLMSTVSPEPVFMRPSNLEDHRTLCVCVYLAPQKPHFIFENFKNVYLFMADPVFITALGLLFLQSMGSRERRLQQLLHVGSVVVAHRLSCPLACGIFPDQGLNLCPLHCKVILNHWTTKEAPFIVFYIFIIVVIKCFLLTLTYRISLKHFY